MAMPTLPRVRSATALLCALMLAAAVVGVVRSARGESDFDGFQRAAAHLWTHGEISTAKDVRRYLPTFQVLLLPLGALPLVPAALLWTLLNLAALAGLPRAIASLSGIAPGRQLVAFWVAAPLLADNLVLGQSAPLLLWLSVTGLARARRATEAAGSASSTRRASISSAVSGGALLGLATLLKIVPAALLVVPLALGRRAHAGRFVLGFVTAIWIGAWATVLAIGPDAALRESARWSDDAGEGQTPWALVETGRSLRFNNQGLAVTLARTFGEMSPEQEVAARGAVRLAALPLTVAWTAWGALLCALALLFAYVAAHARRMGGSLGGPAGAPGSVGAPTGTDGGAGTPEGRARLALLAVASAGMLAVSPVVWTHYFVWMLPALVLLGDRRRLLVGVGLVLAAALLSDAARALGVHMLGLLALTAVAALTEVSRARCCDRDREGDRAPSSLPSDPIL